MSSNAVTEQATACVSVPSFSALQTQCVDIGDPVNVGGDITYVSFLYVEYLSNEGVSNNKVTLDFGDASPTEVGTPGVFRLDAPSDVYYDPSPVVDPNTGVVVSGPTNETSVLMKSGTDYTDVMTTPGQETITWTPGFILPSNGVFYIVSETTPPTGTPSDHAYTTNFIWTSVGLGTGGTGGTTFQASSSEISTVIP